MAGHSHWAGIKHKKGAADTKRGRLFSKLAKNIMSAARPGGGARGAERPAAPSARTAQLADPPFYSRPKGSFLLPA